jgi:protein gp37
MTASKIEWTGRSDWNPIRGCTRVSEGCGSARGGGCYAEVMAARFSQPAKDGKPAGWGHGYAHMVELADGSMDHRWTGKVELIDDRVRLPLGWRGSGFVFPSSTSDIFHEALSDFDIARIFAVMALTPQFTYQLLTKRMPRMRSWIEKSAGLTWRAMYGEAKTPAAAAILDSWYGGPTDRQWPLRNVWTGTSVEDQRTADERLPDLVETMSVLRWVSFEPLISRVDASPWLSANYECSMLCGSRSMHRPKLERCTECGEECDDTTDPVFSEGCPKCGGELEAVCPDCGSRMAYQHPDTKSIDWAVAGGESGPGARDNDFLGNVRFLRDQCNAAGVPFFGKQGYRKRPLPPELAIREMPRWPR